MQLRIHVVHLLGECPSPRAAAQLPLLILLSLFFLLFCEELSSRGHSFHKKAIWLLRSTNEPNSGLIFFWRRHKRAVAGCVQQPSMAKVSLAFSFKKKSFLGLIHHPAKETTLCSTAHPPPIPFDTRSPLCRSISTGSHLSDSEQLSLSLTNRAPRSRPAAPQVSGTATPIPWRPGANSSRGRARC